MFAEIALDRAIIVPGELVISDDGKRRVAVYPLGLAHFSMFSKEVGEVLSAIAGAVHTEKDYMGRVSFEPNKINATVATDAARVLMSTGFRLLNACCVPQLAGPGDPMAPDVVGSWLGQSIPPDMLDPMSEQAAQEDSPATRTPFNVQLARLIANGHAQREILVTVQIGFDGRALPYPGWSYRQLEHWSKANDAFRARENANAAQSVAMAVTACLGGGDGNRAFVDYIESLRSI